MKNVKTEVGMLRRVLVFMLLTALAGCGAQSGPDIFGSSATDGSGSGTDTDSGDTDTVDPDNVAPVASAGLDQSVYEGATVLLPGSGIDEDGTVVLYEWAQLSGTEAAIVNPNSANTSVIIPGLTVAENMVFSLTVTDNAGASDTDTVTLYVYVEYDESGNLKPVVDAGSDQEVHIGQTVYLNGSASDLDGNVVSFQWVRQQGPAIDLSDATEAKATFTAPDVAEDTDIVLVLLATDEQGATGSDEMVITLFADLAVPDNLAVSVDSSEVTLTWDEVASAASYNVYYARETIPVSDVANYNSYLGGMLETDVITNRFVLSSTDDAIRTYYFRVSAVRGEYESDPSDEAVATSTIAVTIGATGKSNDTGLTACYSATAETVCPNTNFGGQDADYGRDADASLVKEGSGKAGFDFIKLDSEGIALAAAAEEWSCVLDVNTGLLWEVKDASGSGTERDSNSYFTWYSTDTSINGGTDGVGTESGGGVCNLDDECNTAAYVDYMNSIALCGYSAWRLPSVDELSSIIDHSVTAPSIDEDYFPNTLYARVYWTSDVYGGADWAAWAVDFNEGVVSGTDTSGSQLAKSKSFFVRLVGG
tara:strand:- start:412 stop:2187 length:1776 start_codon:yes stop_codon:yes gene_type:complete